MADETQADLFNQFSTSKGRLQGKRRANEKIKLFHSAASLTPFRNIPISAPAVSFADPESFF